MKKSNRGLPHSVSMILLMLYDAACVAVSLWAAAVSSYAFVPNQFGFFLQKAWFYFPVAILLCWLTGFAFHRYSGVLRHVELQDVGLQILSVFVAYVLFVAVDFTQDFGFHFLNYRITRWPVYVIAAVLTLFLTVFGRVAFKIWHTIRTRVIMARQNSRRVLIFGAGEAGVFFKRKQDNHPEDLLKPVVFIDDNPQLIGRRISGVPVYGNREKLAEAIERFRVDEVVVAIPTATREVFQYALNVCKEKRCRIQRFGTLDDVDLSKAVLTSVHYEDLLHRAGVTLDMDAVNRFVRDKTVMVTGGVGSIGSEICGQVLSFGCKKLVIYDFNENGLYHINNELSEVYDPSRFALRLGSIRDEARLNEVMDEFHPDVVFHAAAHKHVPMSELNPREAIKNNVFGTYKTALAAIRHNVDKFILISTDKAVNPTSIMGATKRIAERIIQSLDDRGVTHFAAVRFGNVLGSAGSVVPFFQKQINDGGPVTVTHPDMRRYFMTIPEAVQLVLEAGAMASGGEIFVLDMGEPVRIYDLACDLIRLSGYEPGKDIAVEFTGLRPGEKLFEEIRLDAEDFDKTSNAKIVVLKPVPHDEAGLTSELSELDLRLETGDDLQVFEQIQKMVPTFCHEVPASEVSQ